LQMSERLQEPDKRFHMERDHNVDKASADAPQTPVQDLQSLRSHPHELPLYCCFQNYSNGQYESSASLYGGAPHRVLQQARYFQHYKRLYKHYNRYKRLSRSPLPNYGLAARIYSTNHKFYVCDLSYRYRESDLVNNLRMKFL